MNYVNINGQRINLDNVVSYGPNKRNDKEITIDYNCAHSEDIIYSIFKFKTAERANQCLLFLDTKTMCVDFLPV